MGGVDDHTLGGNPVKLKDLGGKGLLQRLAGLRGILRLHQENALTITNSSTGENQIVLDLIGHSHIGVAPSSEPRSGRGIDPSAAEANGEALGNGNSLLLHFHLIHL